MAWYDEKMHTAAPALQGGGLVGGINTPTSTTAAQGFGQQAQTQNSGAFGGGMMAQNNGMLPMSVQAGRPDPAALQAMAQNSNPQAFGQMLGGALENVGVFGANGMPGWLSQAFGMQTPSPSPAAPSPVARPQYTPAPVTPPAPTPAFAPSAGAQQSWARPGGVPGFGQALSSIANSPTNQGAWGRGFAGMSGFGRPGKAAGG